MNTSTEMINLPIYDEGGGVIAKVPMPRNEAPVWAISWHDDEMKKLSFSDAPRRPTETLYFNDEEYMTPNPTLYEKICVFFLFLVVLFVDAKNEFFFAAKENRKALKHGTILSPETHPAYSFEKSVRLMRIQV